MSSRLTINARWHQYAIDGKRVPSVTQVISDGAPKPALVGWAGREAAQWALLNVGLIESLGPDEWVDFAAKANIRAMRSGGLRGTRLHAAAEAMIYGDPLPEINPKTGEPWEWSEDERSTAEQIARAMDDWNLEPVHLEAVVFHDQHLWAGRTDLIARLPDGRQMLLDWKTGKSGIYPDQAIQLCAYAHATHIVIDGEDALMPQIDGCACIHVSPNEYELIPTRNDDATYDVFRHLMVIARTIGARDARDQYVSPAQPIPARVDA